MARWLIALLGLLVAVTACRSGGDTGDGIRVKLYDLSIWGEDSRGTDRRFRSSCSPARLVIDFRAGEELTIRSDRRLVASLTPNEAFIACTDARVEKPRKAQGLPYTHRDVVRVQHSLKLTCVADRRIVIFVTASYKYHDSFAGGSMTVWTPRAAGRRWGRALISAEFSDDEHSVSYHAPRCRVGEP